MEMEMMKEMGQMKMMMTKMKMMKEGKQTVKHKVAVTHYSKCSFTLRWS